MSAKENVQLMHRWFDEVWNQGKAETVHELLAEDAIGMGQGEPRQGAWSRGFRALR